MILVLSGTQDGREIALKLKEAGLNILTTAVSDYGGNLLIESGLEANIGPLQKKDFLQLIQSKGIDKVIDATHPYAREISQIALDICKEMAINYYRYERPEVLTALNEDNLDNSLKNLKIIKVSTISEAATLASQLGDRIFLTIGSNHLEEFLAYMDNRCKVIARVLPDPKVLNKCFMAGLKPGDIIAMQGPFSEEMNCLMLKEKNAQVIVSKDSGKVGGTDSKLLAAAKLNLPIIIIDRPLLNYPRIYDDINQLLKDLKCY